MSTTSLRMPGELTHALDQLAQERGVTRSDLIREAVEAYVASCREGGPEDRVALVRSLVTYEGSGRGDLASRSEEHLRSLFRARRLDRSR
jgi:metal-responsive CopG/Arc/MetJ family transcriptional regulator